MAVSTLQTREKTKAIRYTQMTHIRQTDTIIGFPLPTPKATDKNYLSTAQRRNSVVLTLGTGLSEGRRCKGRETSEGSCGTEISPNMSLASISTCKLVRMQGFLQQQDLLVYGDR